MNRRHTKWFQLTAKNFFIEIFNVCLNRGQPNIVCGQDENAQNYFSFRLQFELFGLVWFCLNLLTHIHKFRIISTFFLMFHKLRIGNFVILVQINTGFSNNIFKCNDFDEVFKFFSNFCFPMSVLPRCPNIGFFTSIKTNFESSRQVIWFDRNSLKVGFWFRFCSVFLCSDGGIVFHLIVEWDSLLRLIN